MGNGRRAGFFAIARKNCANYGSTGPNGKVDYCYPGPNTCVLKDGKFCGFFDRSVIGYKPFREAGLQLKWQERWDGVPAKIVKRICQCGEEFLPASPRQKNCEKCRKLSKREMARLRKRRQRETG